MTCALQNSARLIEKSFHRNTAVITGRSTPQGALRRLPAWVKREKRLVLPRGLGLHLPKHQEFWRLSMF